MPATTAIAAARLAADGATVTVEGVLTTALGATESARGGFLEDDSGGIGIYLDAEVAAAPPRATLVRITGTLDQRYSQTILRVALADIVDLGGAELPNAEVIPTGNATEPYEGRRISIEGEVLGSPSAVSGGFSVTVDDGSGQTRVITTALPTGLGSGVRIRATGPLGQHDSSGTGTGGYRIYALEPGDLVLLEPDATPTTRPRRRHRRQRPARRQRRRQRQRQRPRHLLPRQLRRRAAPIQ